LFRKIYLIILVFIFSISATYAEKDIETKTSPNYFIILVHGINSPGWLWRGEGQNGSDVKDIPETMRGKGDLLGYLKNDLGLDGYVYYYTFSERDGRISTQAKEFGDPNWDNPGYNGSIMNHKGLMNQPDVTDSVYDRKFSYLGYPHPIQTGTDGKGNSWLEQAREDFKQWYANKYIADKDPNKVPESVIPQKYIIIAHSMGGITAREYISSDYYQDNVAALITIDSQHLGAEGALALKKVYEFYKDNKDLEAIGELMGLSSGLLLCRQKELGLYTAFLIPLLAAGRKVTDDLIVQGFLGWYPTQPGVQDMNPQGEFIQNLNSRPFIKDNRSLKVRFIYGGGIPTPSGDTSFNRTMCIADAINTTFSSDWISGLPLGSKLMAIYMSIALGATMNQNGDIYARVKSQKGEGLTILNAPNIDLETYGYYFGEDMDSLKDIVMGALVSMAALDALEAFIPFPAIAWSQLGCAIVYGAGAVSIFQNRLEYFLSGHGLILKKAYEEKIIDKALEDYVNIGSGGWKSSACKPSVIHAMTASEVSTPTAGLPAPSQTFAILSNKNRDGTEAEIYHVVTIEAISESTNHIQAAPIEYKGEKKWVSGVTVKEPPTALKGVINTFLPKKLKSFEYSENFAAWKSVPAIDEWGNFTVSSLNFAEGQNVIAFRGESWIGNKMNQILTITVNTIPMLPSQFIPAPNSFTNNDQPTIGCMFAKAAYSSSPLENIGISLAKLIKPNGEEIDISPYIRTILGGETYNRNIKVEYISPEPLPDGEYKIRIVANSNVGMAQALWAFTVDTTPPMVNFLPSR